ncbi:MAG: hypothetical protein SFW64_08870 [Alphaproteobacteria bacterium]|nr:hypothetical protein [Alphaproteobacteria bacterium]
MNMHATATHKALEAITSHGNSVISNENVVYLMGLSFIVGSLFTIFILVLLDFMRRDQLAKK